MPLRADLVARRGTFEVDAAFDVADGETLALLGPNGAGKSTVVDALLGTLELVRGTITIDGARVDRQPPERRPIGVCFQDDLLFPRLSALENVAFPLRARRVAKADARHRARELLDAHRSCRRSRRATEVTLGRRAAAGRARPRPRVASPGCWCSTSRSRTSTCRLAGACEL